ncbi:COQ9 family protein [Aurantiacibacter poecillastricola]|uniref:COQ9 family protein n=1 Tax=Aurantiacibacter poecillastricola TaxID=3064385 RepID=UPI00273E0C0A|nr:COQ9 family protein [Aurantiacibacter sp. 219JJ12-13]MDP5263190.1 COQ9 family protein [Aurantiacibacter sp. 219JJ12-13]
MAGADLGDLTLDELRIALAPDIAVSAMFDGWTDAALVSAAEMADVEVAVARLAFKGDGSGSLAMNMIEAWIASVDEKMEAEFANGRLDNMPIREKIRTLVWFRLEAIMGMEESLRRAAAIQAMPQNAPRALRQGWSSADKMWRLAGDTATDYNHYTKRAILGSIYAATLAVFVEDESEGKADSAAFLDRRIEGVMKFEKAKAQFLGKDREHFDFARFLGRLRYPQT